MSVAFRAITRLQDADDFGSVPGAGNNGYSLQWDNPNSEFVLAPAVSGALLLTRDVVPTSFTVDAGYTVIYPNMYVPPAVTVTVVGTLINL